MVYDGLLQRPLYATSNLDTVGKHKWRGSLISLSTLTFLPSSFIIYSTVVRIPFSSTESSILGWSAQMDKIYVGKNLVKLT